MFGSLNDVECTVEVMLKYKNYVGRFSRKLTGRSSVEVIKFAVDDFLKNPEQYNLNNNVGYQEYDEYDKQWSGVDGFYYLELQNPDGKSYKVRTVEDTFDPYFYGIQLLDCEEV